jgi:cell division protein DivIC
MIAGIVYFAGQIKGEVQTTFTLLTDINETKAEYDKVLAEKDQLTQQKEQLSNSDYVRTWARGEYLITKEGEEIYKLPAQTTGNGQ